MSQTTHPSYLLTRLTSLLLCRTMSLRLCPGGTTMTLKCGTLRATTKMKLRKSTSKVCAMRPSGPLDELSNQYSEYGLTTVEAVSIAQRLVNRQTTKTHLLNDGFNRYSLNAKDGLPSWFLDDEAKCYKTNIPVTKEAIAALRARQRALDARPIKKIAEAKGRKKLRATQRLEKAMKKADGVNE